MKFHPLDNTHLKRKWSHKSTCLRNCTANYRFRLLEFRVLQIPAFTISCFTDSSFYNSVFNRFRLLQFRVLQFPAFTIPCFHIPHSIPHSIPWFLIPGFTIPDLHRSDINLRRFAVLSACKTFHICSLCSTPPYCHYFKWWIHLWKGKIWCRSGVTGIV